MIRANKLIIGLLTTMRGIGYMRMASNGGEIVIDGVPFARYIPAETIDAHIDTLIQQVLTDYDEKPI